MEQVQGHGNQGQGPQGTTERISEKYRKVMKKAVIDVERLGTSRETVPRKLILGSPARSLVGVEEVDEINLPEIRRETRSFIARTTRASLTNSAPPGHALL